MVRKIEVFLSCCLVLALMHHTDALASHSPCPPNAATSPIVTVVIGTETRTGTDQVILNDTGGAPHTYPNGLTIAPLAGGNALVRVECDTAGDKLSLMNAKITVTAPVTNQVIQFWATFDKPPLPTGHPTPTPQTPPNVFYRLVGINSGTITSNNAKAAAFDKIVTKAEIFNPVPGGTWKTIGTITKTVSTTDPNPVPVFPNTLSWMWPRPPELLGERHIRNTVTITLKNAADRVELGNGIIIENSATACEDCGPGGDEQPPSAWCMTTNSTAKAFGCPSCLTEDGMVAQNKKLELFVKSSWPSLSENMAQGHGEHLTALANLIQISRERQEEFFTFAQANYGNFLLHNGDLSPEAMIAALQDRWASQSLVSSIR